MEKINLNESDIIIDKSIEYFPKLFNKTVYKPNTLKNLNDFDYMVIICSIEYRDEILLNKKNWI